MKNKFHLIEIIKDSKSSLKKSLNRSKNTRFHYNLIWNLFPVLISLFLIFLKYFVSDNLIGHLITGISIFAGLFFSLLVLITDKANKKKAKYSNSKNEEDIVYLKRYLNFSKYLISYIAHNILISILIIILLFCTQIFALPINYQGLLLEYYFQILIVYLTNFFTYLLLIRFIILLSIIISQMYAALYEELK